MKSPPPPENVVATVNANDSISLEWTFDPTWFAFDGTDDSLGGLTRGCGTRRAVWIITKMDSGFSTKNPALESGLSGLISMLKLLVTQ